MLKPQEKEVLELVSEALEDSKKLEELALKNPRFLLHWIETQNLERAILDKQCEKIILTMGYVISKNQS